MDWNDYEIFDPGVEGPLNTLTRGEAKQAFARLMSMKEARIEMLRSLLQANGVDLGSSDAAIQDLNDWFFANVEPHPSNPGRLLPEWYSVVRDLSLFLGDLMIARHPNLRWELFTWGAKNVSYQRAVIMGFGTEDPKFHTNIDIERNLSTYGHRIIAQRGSVAELGTVTVRGTTIDVDAAAAQHRAREIEPDAFWRWLQNAAQRA